MLQAPVSLAEEDIAHQHWLADILLVHRQPVAGYALDLERRSPRQVRRCNDLIDRDVFPRGPRDVQVGSRHPRRKDCPGNALDLAA